MTAPRRLTIAEQIAARWAKPRNQPRTCDRCGRPYGRRNLIEAWDTQNPGHRDGWSKTKLRICTKCAGATTARRTLMVGSIIRAQDVPEPPARKIKLRIEKPKDQG